MCNCHSTYCIDHRGKQNPNLKQIIETQIKENVKLATSETHKHRNCDISRRNTWIDLRSRTEKLPSSHPEAIMELASLIMQVKMCVKYYEAEVVVLVNSRIFRCTYLFHEITFTSAIWAFIEIQGFFPVRISHIAIVPSTEQEANTSASVGLHCKDISYNSWDNHIQGNILITWYIIQWHACRSSTLAVCPTNGFASTFQLFWVGSHRWMHLLQSPA